MNKTPFDYKKLRGRIREKFTTQAAFASAIGISNVSVSNKLNNIIDWRQEEIEKATDVLEIPYTEVHTYFFTHEVEKNTTYAERITHERNQNL